MVEFLQEFEERYSILHPLGKGGSAQVFLAANTTNPRDLVAVKVVPHTKNIAETRERIRREFDAIRLISSENVVQAIELYQTESTSVLVQEYAAGDSLFEVMHSSRRLHAEEIVRILYGVAKGLSAIHRANIIHRDIKPSNILIGKHGEVKLIDFGVSLQRNQESLTLEGFMVGTPKYLAPEYIETGECDERSDIYGLGVIGYELLIGNSPFVGQTDEAVLLDRFRQVTIDRSLISTLYPMKLIDIIEKALKTSVSQRFQAAEELCKDLLEVGIWSTEKESLHSEKRNGFSTKLIEKIAVFQNLIGF